MLRGLRIVSDVRSNEQKINTSNVVRLKSYQLKVDSVPIHTIHRMLAIRWMVCDGASSSTFLVGYILWIFLVSWTLFMLVNTNILARSANQFDSMKRFHEHAGFQDKQKTTIVCIDLTVAHYTVWTKLLFLKTSGI